MASLNYLSEEYEITILQKKLAFLSSKDHQQTAKLMVKIANLSREAFKNGDISNLISLRTLISFWGVANKLNFSFISRLI